MTWRRQGEAAGAPSDLAATANWRKVTVTRYGRDEQVWAAERRCLWHGAFGCRQARVALIRETGRDHGRGGYDLALATTDPDSPGLRFYLGTHRSGGVTTPSLSHGSFAVLPAASGQGEESPWEGI